MPVRQPPVSVRFWGLLLAGVLSLCAAYVALLLNTADYADVRALSQIQYHDEGYYFLPTRLSAAGFAFAQHVSAAVAIGLVLLAGWGLTRDRARPPLRELGRQAGQVVAGTLTHWRQLSRNQRRTAGLSLVLLTAGRVYFSLNYPYHTDEVASYDFFISRGLLAVSSFYPIPNNHILAGTLGWAFYQLSPAPWLVLRLPVLLTATAGTVALFAGLLRLSSFWVAFVSLNLFGWMQLSLNFATAGRGYWLLIGLAGLCFLAVVALRAPRPAAPHLAWALLLLSAVLGCYTVPPFVYVVASALGCLGWTYLRRRAWAALAGAVAVGAGTVAAAAVLYAPVLLVSGQAALFGNRYVASKSLTEVLGRLPGFFWAMEGKLLGSRAVGAAALLLGLALLAWLRHPARFTRLLSPAQRGAVSRFWQPALWFILLPYLLMLLQRVVVPDRVLVYKGLLSALLWGLLADVWLSRPGRRWRRGLVLALLLGFAAAQFRALARVARKERPRATDERAAFRWLAAQPPGPVLVAVRQTALYLLYYGHQHRPRRRWHFDDSRRRPGVRYRYVLVPTGYGGAHRHRLPAQPAYRDATQEIYVLSTPAEQATF